MASDTRMAGRVALITGGGGEIGSAIAARLASASAAVAVGDLDPAKAEATGSGNKADPKAAAPKKEPAPAKEPEKASKSAKKK